MSQPTLGSEASHPGIFASNRLENSRSS